MSTKIYILVAILLSGVYKLKAQISYTETFKGLTAQGVVFGGSPAAFLTAGAPTNDGDGNGFLRLTSNQPNQKGYIYNTIDFPTNEGLSIEFEYFSYGGLGGNNGADGLTFFLFDGAVGTDFKIGGFGGSLGYAPYSGQGETSTGLKMGYLGVGLDEYGNFSDPGEGRNSGPGRRTNSVTLRGSYLNNYNYLTHAQTKMETDGEEEPSLDIDENMRVTNPFSVGYRKAFIDLKPNPLGGFNITVKIYFGGNPARTLTLINNYYYNVPAPAKLRYGFAASTGLYYNYHEIRNLKINAFTAEPVIPPNAVNDSKSTYADTPVSIDIAANDVPQAGKTINRNSITIVSQPANGTVTINPLTFNVVYTPKPGFSGNDSFTYSVQDNTGQLSNTATVSLEVKPRPKGSNDAIYTTTNVPVVSFPIKDNDVDKAGTSVVKKTDPAKGVVTINTDGTITYTPETNSYGSYTFTYVLKNADGAESDPVTVTIKINDPPKALNDAVLTPFNTAVSIPVVNNDTDADGSADSPLRSSVQVKTAPLHGTYTINANGTVSYVPSNGFIGTDSFTYTVKDNDGAESAPATVTVNVVVTPKLGLAKAATQVRRAMNGSYDIIYVFTLKNFGQIGLKNMSLEDDLGLAFPGAQFVIQDISATGSLVVNNSYNGFTNTELLDASSTLPAGEAATLQLGLNVKLSDREGLFLNTATASGLTTTGSLSTSDKSTAGLKPDPVTDGDVSPADPTIVELKFSPLFIPEGFSPNNDGVNDSFVIRNAENRTISIQMFNRWGNRVYASDNYQNDWDGKCREGLCLGEDLPPGTYYYIILLDSTEKYTGYITLNR